MMENSCDLQSQCSDSCMEKENHPQTVSPMKHESDLSMYNNSSPKQLTCSMHPIRTLGDHDSNSQDSGYGPGCLIERNKFFEFAQSLGVTPRVDSSPMKTCSSSFESMGYVDDEFLELGDIGHPINDNYQLPSDFNSLLNGSFISFRSRYISPQYDDNQRMKIRRAVSYDVTGQTPNSSRVRSCLFKKDDADFHSIKRRDRSEELISPIQNKRSRIEIVPLPDLVVPQRPVFGRSMSTSEESIKFAVHRSSTEPDLIGDFSKAFCLPLTSGKHQDLKSITPCTLALLLRGKYRGLVNSYKVIDCRYPYEYNGGHIEEAINLYTKEQILERLLDIKVTLEEHMEKLSRNILVFHCEFSSERGPNLYRFLRKWDRFRNTDVYPALHYPEVYLLEGGYKQFYEQFPELCVPEAYLPMLDPGYSKDLKLYRAKSKSWNEDRYKGSLKGLDRI